MGNIIWILGKESENKVKFSKSLIKNKKKDIYLDKNNIPDRPLEEIVKFINNLKPRQDIIVSVHLENNQDRYFVKKEIDNLQFAYVVGKEPDDNPMWNADIVVESKENKVLASSIYEPITVVCALWGKWCDPFGFKYVEILKNMVERNTTVPFEFVCLTTLIDPEKYDHPKGITFIPMPEEVAKWEYCLPKFFMYSKKANLKGKILFFDLDTVIIDNIDKLATLNCRGRFIGLKPWFSNNWGKNWYSGSILMWHSEDNWQYMWDEVSSDPEGWANKTEMSRGKGRERIALSYLVPPHKGLYFQDILPDGYLQSYKLHVDKGIKSKNLKIICYHGNKKPHQTVGNRIVRKNWR